MVSSVVCGGQSGDHLVQQSRQLNALLVCQSGRHALQLHGLNFPDSFEQRVRPAASDPHESFPDGRQD